MQKIPLFWGAVILTLFALISGTIVWYSDISEEIILSENIILKAKTKGPLVSFKTLKINNAEKVENAEINFLQDGDIWALNKDLKIKSKLIDTAEKITEFSLSPDGKETYWINEKGELWKQNENKEIKPLATVEKDMEKKIQEIPDVFEKESFPYYKGKVMDFWLSPDGNYIAYKTLEGYTGCCAGPPDIPVSEIRIMKNDGTGKVIVEWPAVWRSMVIFHGWMPDSKKIITQYQNADEAIQGSAFFETGVNGKNPKIYTEIFKIIRNGAPIEAKNVTAEDIRTLTLYTTIEPIYSPGGESVAYINEEDQVRLKDISTKETKTILESESLPFGSSPETISWSKNGNLLLVKGTEKVFIFDKTGNKFFETKIGNETSSLPVIDSAILSYDNKYIGGVYKPRGEKPEIIFLTDITTGEKKEFQLPELKPISEKHSGLYIQNQLFSKEGKFFYLRKLPETDTGELWIINTGNWKNYKFVENISQIEKTL